MSEYDAAAYAYTQEYQEDIIRLVFNNAEFFLEHDEVLVPGYFQDTKLQGVLKGIKSHYQEFGIYPHKTERQEILVSKDLDPVKFLDGSEILVKNRKSVSKKIVEFAKHQRLMTAFNQSLDVLQSGKFDFDKIEGLVQNALNVGITPDQAGIILREEEVLRTIGREPGVLRQAIPTGLKDLDTVMGGGLGIQEMGIIQAKAKTGKTLVLLLLAANAWVNGRNVAFYSMEGGTDYLLNRFYAVITQMTAQERAEDPELAAEIFLNIKTEHAHNADIVFKSYPTNTCNRMMIQKHLDYMESQCGFEPDLIIVDYGDIMAPPPGFRSSSPGDASREKYAELLKLAQELKVPLWTASQSNRQDGIAGSYEKYAMCHIAIDLTQTEAQKENCRMLLEVKYNRAGPGGDKFEIGVDYSKHTIYECTDTETIKEKENE